MKRLSEIYLEVEEASNNCNSISELADILKNYRDLFHQENMIDDAKKCQFEIDCFYFQLRNNKLNPMSVWTSNNGSIIEYPSLKDFTDESYDYLKVRLTESASNILKARYSHLLWLSPQKHINYAKIAIDSYLYNLKQYEIKDLAEPESYFGHSLKDAITNAFLIAISIDYKIPEIKAEIIRFSLNYNINSSSVFANRLGLISLMLDNSKVFKNDDFNGLIENCESLATAVKVSNPHLSIDIYETIIKIAKKIKTDFKRWKIVIAQIYEEMSEKRETLVAVTFCEDAIKIYKELKDNVNVKRLEEKYKLLKDSIELDQFEHKFDMSEIIKECKSNANIITDNDTNFIIETLMFDPNVIPTFADIDNLVKESIKNAPFLHIVPTSIIDNNGHTSEYFSDEQEKYYYDMLWQLDMSLKLARHFYIRELLLQSIKKKKLDTKKLLNYFNQHSWFGKNLSKKIPNGKDYNYNWLNLLAPSFLEYFKIVNSHLANPNVRPNFVLPIDSLTIKFEGLIRDICLILGITTFYFTTDKKNRNIAREKDINALLHEPELVKFINQDDLFFLKYLLIEKAGLNLRNMVAHSLIKYEEYAFDYMNLLIIGLIKLGKCDFKNIKMPSS